MSYFEDQEDLHEEGFCDGAPGCHMCQAMDDYEAQQKKMPTTKQKPVPQRAKKER